MNLKGGTGKTVRNKQYIPLCTGLEPAVYQHKKFKHAEKTFPCDQCEFTSPSLATVKSHIKVVHEGAGIYISVS